MSTEAETPTSSWAHFAHDADIGVVGVGATKAEAFRQAALALTAVVTVLSKVRPLHLVPVFCQARRVIPDVRTCGACPSAKKFAGDRKFPD